MLYEIIRFTLINFFRLFIKKIKGLENLPEGGFIIAANHSSFFDPPMVSAIVADKLKIKVHNLGKTELFRSFLGRTIQNIGGTIPLDTTGKDKSGINKAISYLKQGKVIEIFPEGGRSKDGKLKEGKTGAVRIALKAKVPIVPIGVEGTYDIWSRNKKIFRIKKIAKVNIGRPIYFDRYYKSPISKKLLKNLTGMLMKEIAKLCGQTYKY